MTPKKVPYVKTRDGVWQYERRVPAHIRRDRRRFAELFDSKPLYRRSLGTKDYTAMLAALDRVHREYERLIGATVNAGARIKAVPSTRVVTDEDLQAIARRYFDLTVQSVERLHRLANVDAAAANELERIENAIELDGELIRATLSGRFNAPEGPILRPEDEARHVIADFGFVAPEGSEELGAVVGAVRLGMQKGFARLAALSAGDSSPSLPAPVVNRPQKLSHTLRHAVESYLKDRTVPAKAASETRLALRQFESVAGNKLLAAITRDDMVRFVRHLSDQQVGGKSAGSVIRHLSHHTIGKRLRMLSAALSHAIELGHLDADNPALGIKVAKLAKAADKRVMPDKRRFKVEELNRIFQHPWFTGCKSATEKHLPGTHRLLGSEYWAPVVSVLTGCRAGELGGMKLIEVRLEGRFPHFVVRPNEYRRIKGNRTRCVPILDALLELGFAGYVERIAATGADRLFPDWVARISKGGDQAGYPAWSNGNIIRSFNRTVIPWALGNQMEDGARRDVTFHSFRGAFKAMLGTSNKLPLNVVHEVIGHAKSELDERYIGELTIEETYPLVHRCRYDGLIIPALY